MVFIDKNGNVLKDFTYKQAKKLAQEDGLDLVEVSKDVFRILNKGKWEYEKNKQNKKNQKKNKTKTKKTVKLEPNIAKHDLETKIRHTRAWLLEGRPVEVVMTFKGRMITHKEIGEKIIQELLDSVQDVGSPQKRASLTGNVLNILLLPKKNA